MSDEMSAAVVDRLLERLSDPHDDDFRALFESDPRAALAAVGHPPAADPNVHDGCWTCLKVTRLADPATIAAARRDLRRQLLAAAATQKPISLQV